MLFNFKDIKFSCNPRIRFTLNKTLKLSNGLTAKSLNKLSYSKPMNSPEQIQ